MVPNGSLRRPSCSLTRPMGCLFLLSLLPFCLACVPSPHQPLGGSSSDPKQTPAEAPDGNVASNPEGTVGTKAASTASASATQARLASLPLISRQRFFGNPEKARVRVSPDGKNLAYLAPLNGVLNIWVAPTADWQAARPVTEDTKRGIHNFVWAYTGQHILYDQDRDGDENDQIYCVDLESERITNLTPLEDIAASIENASERFPDEILVGINDRGNHEYHDIYRVNLRTGERALVQTNPGFAGFVTDDDYRVRFAMNYTPTGGQVYLQPASDEPTGWREFLALDAQDTMTSGLLGFDKTGRSLYLLDSRQRNTAALWSWHLDTGDRRVLAENARADLSGVIAHPTEKNVQAVTFTYARQEWQILDESIRADLDYLQTVADGELEITSRSLDDQWWTVAYIMDNGPVRFYLYHRPQRAATFLFTSDSQLAELPLVKMHPVVITSRDKLSLVSYLTLPHGEQLDDNQRMSHPLPMVLDVHGGPWSRDDWGYNPLHQLLANRGYAVLSTNFRGSTGFGKEFINAANGEWGARMHDDLIDAVQWAVGQGIADAQRVAITGGSYGGYAALVGLTMTPDTFACAVDSVGPSNLITLLENPPPYWMPFMPVMKHRVGDHQTESGREFLRSRSPLTLVERIKRPLLIAQGAQDPRVKRSEADQIVASMQQHQIPVTYMLFPEEGHGIVRPENRFAFYAVMEAFLAEHLGGRAEPIGTAFQQAHFEIPAGRDQVRGLAEAMEPLEAAPPTATSDP